MLFHVFNHEATSTRRSQQVFVFQKSHPTFFLLLLTGCGMEPFIGRFLLVLTSASAFDLYGDAAHLCIDDWQKRAELVCEGQVKQILYSTTT